MNTKVAMEKFLLAWSKSEVDGQQIYLNKPGVIKFSKADYNESLLTEFDQEAIKNGVDKSWISMARKGALIIEAYAEQILPKIQEVFFVQKNIKLTNADGDSFVGVIDFCARWEDGKVYIFDNKTTSVKYKEDSVITSEQLSTYVEAMKDDIKIDGAGYITIPKKIRKQKLPLVPIEVILGNISEDLIEKTFQMYDEVLHGIKMGRFPCTPEKCAETPWGCGFERYCESDGKDLTGLKFHQKRLDK